MLRLPDSWPAMSDVLEICRTMNGGTAAILIILGFVYLLFGIYIFRGLVVLNAAFIGALFGAIIGERAGSTLAGALVGAFLCGAVSWPLMRYAVAIMGGLYGLLLGASIWRAFGLEPAFAWAGGLTGLVGLGMLTFIIFRGSIMMFMSLQGSVMLIFGLLGLIYKYQSVAPVISEHMLSNPMIMPMLILIPTVLGVIYQQSQYGQPAEGGSKKK